MDALYPNAPCALTYTDPFSLVIAVLLSAQTTDAAVNKVTPAIFERWPTPADLASAPLDEVENTIHTLGFFRSKARHMVGCAQMLVSDFGGEVPRTMEELVRLPGVGRKTANVVLGNAFGIVEGIAVDTHVFRIATRLGLTAAAEPLDAEQDLLRLIPRELWGPVNHQWVLFGRQVCDARKPACLAEGSPCPLADLCPSRGKAPQPKKKKPAAQRP
jgi:endonuclease-3